MTARDLVADLRGRGLRLAWGRRGLSLAGDVGRLTPEHRQALARHRAELEALAAWSTLQDEAEARFGWPGARLYPFAPADSGRWWTGPIVRTPLGAAYLLQVRLETAWIVRVEDVDRWRDDPTASPSYGGPSHLVPHADVWPPATPPTNPAPITKGDTPP